jgi:hypothetical protein
MEAPLDTARIRQLLDKRDDIDRELQELISGKKPVKCSHCGGENHTARNCPSRPPLRVVPPEPNGNGAA